MLQLCLNEILTWRHDSGFSAHNEVRLQAGDGKGIENVAQCIIRNAFSPATLSYIEKTGTNGQILWLVLEQNAGRPPKSRAVTG
jgi:hypothetical protein